MKVTYGYLKKYCEDYREFFKAKSSRFDLVYLLASMGFLIDSDFVDLIYSLFLNGLCDI